MKYIAKFIFICTKPFASLNRWAEHRYNTIEANEKCLKYIINHE